MPAMILYSYNISPYAAKVRAILRYKGLAFEERLVHPLKRGHLKKISGQLAVPVLDDGGHVVADSTRISRYLDEKYPAQPILPADPTLRARALLLEEWADEGLPRVVQPVRWFIPRNAEHTCKLFRSGYPAGKAQDLAFAAVAAYVRRGQRHRYGIRNGGTEATVALNRLAEVMGVVDAALAETGWLAGPAPSVADFAVWGFLNFLEELDGWETVKTHKRVVKLVKTLGESRSTQPEAYDSDDAALLDASHHRRSKLPVISS